MEKRGWSNRIKKLCLFSRTQNIQDQNQEVAVLTRGKRKADNSPLRNDKVKRSALGNLTNNVKNGVTDDDPMQGLKNAVQCNQKVSLFGFRFLEITSRLL